MDAAITSSAMNLGAGALTFAAAAMAVIAATLQKAKTADARKRIREILLSILQTFLMLSGAISVWAFNWWLTGLWLVFLSVVLCSLVFFFNQRPISRAEILNLVVNWANMGVWVAAFFAAKGVM